MKMGKDEHFPILLQRGRFTVIAWNPEKRWQWESAKAAKKTLNQLAKKRRISYRGRLPFVGGIVGYCSSDVGYELLDVSPAAKDSWRLPLVYAGEYAQVMLWDGESVFVVGPKTFERRIKKIHGRPLPTSAHPPLRFRASISSKRYRSDVEKIQRLILSGDIYQINHTYTLEAKSSCKDADLFHTLYQQNPVPYAAYMNAGTVRLLSLSPERFISIENGRIETCPIKGTRARGKTPAEDEQKQKELLESDKESAELTMITDLLRNDIGSVSVLGSVQVTGHRLLQKMSSVWHTFSSVQSQLEKKYSPIDALFAMLPGGSVTGCPKKRAYETIDQLEQVRRGPYTGALFSLSDHGVLDSSLLIRTLVRKGTRCSLGIGGGIVADSDVQKEWEETQHKAKPFLKLKPVNILLKKGIVRNAQYKKTGAAVLEKKLLAFPKKFHPSNPEARGVFETMCIEKGKIVDLEAHTARLQKSALYANIRLPLSRLELHSVLASYAKKIMDTARIKIVCSDKESVIASEPLYSDPYHEQGIAVTIIRTERKMPEAKMLPYHKEWRAHEQARDQGYGEALLQRKDGGIPEAAYANLFWVRNNILCTPDEGILEGVTRAKVLAQARALNIAIYFSTPKKSDLLHADEIFLTKSTTGITPVIKIDQLLIGSGKVGVLTKKLME